MPRPRFVTAIFLLGSVTASLCAFAGCGSDDASGEGPTAQSTASGAGGSGSTSGGDGGDLFSDDAGLQCQNLECQVADCGSSPKTSLSGVVYDPAGKTPLYNVVVYVPNAPLEPIPEGASCDQCGSTLADPIAVTLTDTHGRFTLSGVPSGDDIPLVFQVGKWRRQVTIPHVDDCVDHALDDPDLTRLPRSQAEGNLPRIALTTGGADPLECLLRKIGVDDGEFTPAGGTGRVHIYSGYNGATRFADSLNGGASFEPALSLWGTLDTLMAYDVLLLACEGDQDPSGKPDTARQAMFDYTAQGGRVFASHWHNYWLEEGPDPFPTVATFNHQEDLSDPFTALIDTTFPKGESLADWLVNVGASSSPGTLSIHEGQHTIDAVNPSLSQRWIYGDSPQSVQYLTFNTPLDAEAEEQCGRMVLSDIHVSSGDQVGTSFPGGCVTTDLSPQEKALEFMLFDLSSCIQPDDEVPTPPQ
jgi:hypothetical protein